MKRYLILLILILFPLILLLLPKTQFDHGPTSCLITIITGENCFGCGMTRACMRLIHLDINGAWNYNKLSFLVFPILCFIYLKYFFSFLKLSKSKNSIS